MSSSKKLPPLPVEILPPGKKITKEEAESLNNSLFYESDEKKKKLIDKNHQILEGGMYHSAQLSKAQVSGLVRRIYEAPMENAKKKIELREAAQFKEKEASRKVLNTDDLQQFVTRSYAVAMEKKKARDEALIAKYRPEPEHKKLSSSDQAAFVQRNFVEAIAKRKAEKEKLYKTCVEPLDPVFAKLTKEELAATATRLSTKK